MEEAIGPLIVAGRFYTNPKDMHLTPFAIIGIILSLFYFEYSSL